MAGVESVFVGHPLMDEPEPLDRSEVRKQLGVGPGEPMVALLPGSRPGEVARHSGAMLEAAAGLSERGIRTVISLRGDVCHGTQSADPVTLPGTLRALDLLGAADAALVASGTATLEAAVARVPLAVVYRLDSLSWLGGRFLVKVPYIGLPNWIAGGKIVPELLQGEVTGPKLFSQALALLEPSERKRQQRALDLVARSLGGPGAAHRVGDLVMERF